MTAHTLNLSPATARTSQASWPDRSRRLRRCVSRLANLGFSSAGFQCRGQSVVVLMALRFIRHVNERDREIRIAGANMSISLGYNPKNHACGWTPVCEEVRRLVRSGVVVVVAVGNSGYQWALTLSGSASATATGTSKGSGFTMVSVTDPGNTEEAITVGSTHALHPYRYGTQLLLRSRTYPRTDAPSPTYSHPANTSPDRSGATSSSHSTAPAKLGCTSLARRQFSWRGTQN